jgi:hypothetical protein
MDEGPATPAKTPIRNSSDLGPFQARLGPNALPSSLILPDWLL